MFHLGWFLKAGFGLQGWGAPFSGTIEDEWMQPEFYIEMACALERAGFDYLMIEDSSMINDTYQGHSGVTLRRAAGAPKNDPMPLVPIIARGSRHIGIVATVTTSFYPPFLAARLGATLDHLTRGRFGFNIVTASGHRAAQNYGLEKHIEHDKRYDIADEWMEVVDQLWKSWEPGAVVADQETGVYADHTHVKPIHFEGTYFRSRGPLNTFAGPQGRPVICQAGGSPAGRGLAAKHADTIVAAANGVPAMKAYKQDICAMMEGSGRNPNDCKVMFLVSPVVGETDQEAQERFRRIRAAEAADLTGRLERISYMSGIDVSKFDLDEPLPEDIEARINGHRSPIKEMLKNGRTLREMARYTSVESVDLVGSPDTVASQMEELMQEIGGDGFLMGNTVTRRTIAEIADGLGPVLRRRGLTRNGFDHACFRDNLLAF
jgi:FMN-dependent oxidoreductase (nitrilotriacetate monooxygenase family)